MQNFMLLKHVNSFKEAENAMYIQKKMFKIIYTVYSGRVPELKKKAKNLESKKDYGFA